MSGFSRDVSAHVAQSVEHVLGKDEVSGSIPLVGSTDALRSGGRGFGSFFVVRTCFLEDPHRVQREI